MVPSEMQIAQVTKIHALWVERKELKAGWGFNSWEFWCLFFL